MFGASSAAGWASQPRQAGRGRLRAALPAVTPAQKPATVLLFSTDTTLSTSLCFLHHRRRMHVERQRALVTQPGQSSSTSLPSLQIPGAELATATISVCITHFFQQQVSGKSVHLCSSWKSSGTAACDRRPGEGSYPVCTHTFAQLRSIFGNCSAWDFSR